MSLRALKKRDNQISATHSKRQSSLYKKSSANFAQQQQRSNYPTRPLINRRIHSCPELRQTQASRQALAYELLVRTKSENDLSNLLQQNSVLGHAQIAAKSEIRLESISTHNYQTSVPNQRQTMLSGAHAQRDLRQSAYLGASTSTISGAELGPNAVLRVPIIGYEVMEERARFTVYKLRVENPQTNDCWLVLRRYTDFVRLQSKLKQGFPHMTLLLPRKKIFGDNFNAVFLDNRVQGLQMFVNAIMAKEELRKSKIVREFFCLDEPPTYSESMEECRAIFEAQEETIAHLKLQINSKNELILSLQQKLREELNEKEQLKEALKNRSALNCSQGSSSNGSTTSN